MKKINFLLAFMLISLFTFGGTVKNNYSNVGTLKLEKTKISNDQINLKLDLGDITNIGQEKIENTINEFINHGLNEVAGELQCSIRIQAEVSIGVISFTIEVEVSGNCSDVRKYGKALANQIIEEVQAELRN
jgi:hypothetical protein